MEQSIIEGNKLIAEFMGGKLQDVFIVKVMQRPKFYFSDDIKSPLIGGKHSEDGDTLQYHSSWDWLMPCCKKFDEIDTLKMTPQSRKHYEIDCCSEIGNAVARYDIDAAWTQLVKSIQWYNSQNSKIK